MFPFNTVHRHTKEQQTDLDRLWTCSGHVECLVAGSLLVMSQNFSHCQRLPYGQRVWLELKKKMSSVEDWLCLLPIIRNTAVTLILVLICANDLCKWRLCPWTDTHFQDNCTLWTKLWCNSKTLLLLGQIFALSRIGLCTYPLTFRQPWYCQSHIFDCV